MLKRLLRAGLLALAASVLVAAGHAVAAARSARAEPPAPPADPAASPSSPGSSAPGTASARYQAPLDGPVTVTRGFEPPSDRYAAGHRGVDLAGVPGQLVRSAGPGTVVFAGMVGGRPVVSVEHPGGVRTTYEPVAPTVVAGQAVSPGTQLGTLRPGHPQCPVAACLHWGLRSDEGVYLDPLSLLQRSRVRLLPVT
ncbi:murein hydrolase activator EnvC family protein [Dactylosporangium sp. CA-092794]|uniref:murein hydrolase activator EnvC family protein n=1 Tax=Dactylosporangium sp. CA-092794 TaxID=3239929 RepID=UPI003D8A10D7